MSAFICDDYHISVLAVYAASGREQAYVYYDGKLYTPLDAHEVAAILHAENVRSVNERYRKNEQPSFTFQPAAYRCMDQYSPVEIIKACNCYNYQACETDDYSSTLAKCIIDAIVSKAIRRLPGYEAAEWGIRGPMALRKAVQTPAIPFASFDGEPPCCECGGDHTCDDCPVFDVNPDAIRARASNQAEAIAEYMADNPQDQD
jgi:hypothetical protein